MFRLEAKRLVIVYPPGLGRTQCEHPIAVGLNNPPSEAVTPRFMVSLGIVTSTNFGYLYLHFRNIQNLHVGSQKTC